MLGQWSTLSSLAPGRTWVIRAAVFTSAWWAIIEGRSVGWYFGVLAITGATALSVLLLPPGRWTARGILRFLPFFVVESVRGGLDVAFRALRPGTNIRPAFKEVVLETSDPQLRLFTANVISLMPGTLAARLSHGSLVVHLLDEQDAAPRLPRALARVGQVTGDTSKQPSDQPR